MLSILTAGLLFACLLTSPNAAALAPALERHTCRDTLQQLLADLQTVARAVEYARERQPRAAARPPHPLAAPKAPAGFMAHPPKADHVDPRPPLRFALHVLPPPARA